jgi:hypothetical protein
MWRVPAMIDNGHLVYDGVLLMVFLIGVFTVAPTELTVLATGLAVAMAVRIRIRR